MPESILIVDDELSMRKMLTIFLQKEGYNPVEAPSAEKALEILEQHSFPLVISDIAMPGLSGLDLLKNIKERNIKTDVILITAYASTDSAIEALKLGAFDYITKPFSMDDLKHSIENAIENSRLREENIQLRTELLSGDIFSDIVGKSNVMISIFDLIRRVSPTNSTILIQGESGTGKELVAKALHKLSDRNGGPFVSINCAVLTETLLESELFGYVKGSFTGAMSNKQGLFEVAQHGTLFLDEIGDMSPSMQVKLLRALQEKKVRPIGSDVEIPIDARIITATNRDLYKMVENKEFREDLYYRIAVIPINIPPLKDRIEDIPSLSQYFINKYNKEMNKKIKGLSEKVLNLFESYSWPGNVRELENTIERAITMELGDVITVKSLPENIVIGSPEKKAADIDIPDGFDLTSHIDEMRKVYIRKALKMEKGAVVKAAKRLGLSFRSLRYFISKYKIAIE